MNHPLQGDLSHFSDMEIENKIQEITKKYWIVHRSNNRDLLTQLDTFVKIYKSELMARQQARMKQDFNGDLDQLINVS